jgi:AcrR family transcriptional regulator
MQGKRHEHGMATTGKKRGYHHGDLKAALTDAAWELVRTQGTLDVTLAAASRMAGVSTAAPYRHFADKEALLDAVRARGFAALTERMRAAAAAVAAPGTTADVVAIGQAYVRFAHDEPAVFRLMFGSRQAPRPDALSRQVGEQCFGTLLERVDLWRAAAGGGEPDTHALALPLWSLVHGVATLEIDGDFEAVAPSAEPETIVARTTRSFLAGLRTGGAA